MKTALIVAALGLLVSGTQLVHSSGYGQESSYASAGSSYGGSDGGSYSAGGGGGYDDHANPASYGVHAERPRVNLGISLKVPAMKINLGRMNMPRISIRAKIKQSHAPKVINVPEMHIDTNSKIPGPQGAQAVGHGHGGDSYSSYGGSSSYGGESSSYGSGSSGYGGGSSGYGAGSSGYGQAAPSYAAPEPSYGGSAPSGPSYGSSGYESAGSSYAGQASAGGYGQSGSGGYSQGNTGGYGGQAAAAGYGKASAGGYEMSAGGYEAAPASYESGPSYSSGGQGGASYESAEPAYAPAASHAPAASYSDSPAPTQYGRKPYGASSAPVTTGGYGPTGPSNYNAAYNGARPMASLTRNQYGSSATAYNAPQQQYQPQQSHASQPRPSQSYGGSYAPQMNAGPSGYQAAGNAAYGASGPSYPSGGYQATKPAPSYKQAPTYEASGYSNVASAYEPAGYQPLEPGHTLITASNDNYDGLTRMAVASNPPKEYPKYPAHGPSVTYETPSTYSSAGGNNYAASYNQKEAPAAPAYSAPAYGPQNNQYNANQQAAYPMSSYDEGAAQVDQGNYGARMGSSAAQSGGYVEAY